MEEKRKIRVGQVVGVKMDKTAIVAMETARRHPIYKKTIRRTVKYKIHDPENKCQLGDTVRIIETRPLSREKRWALLEIISRKEVAEIQPGDITT